ncbi:MAG: glycosyltransferase [Deltaproteobacteria bacterium]|nr:glycosyltransferase [Deltaproteobacteria bacterium]MBM4286863.1 glycosyltransferase [Deltaproteobacteria bacterium]
MKILFIGNCSPKSTSLQRFNWMRQLGHDIAAVDSNRFFPFTYQLPLWKRVENRLGIGPSFLALNRQVLAAAQVSSCDLLWVEKGVHLFPQTLAACRKYCSSLASFHLDDPFTRRGSKGWRHHLAGMSYYDVLFVSKKAVALDCLQRGARCVYETFSGYDPHLHRPVTRDLPIPALSGSVIFIGHYEAERERFLEAVLNVTPHLFVSSWGWEKCRSTKLRQAGVLHCEGLWGDDYAAALSQAGIALGLLTRNHRDLHTSRSFEIPACGGFMLAERTVEHLLLFQEGVEAEFFADLVEMVDKVKYYLAHPDEARAIGQRGRQRCLESGYGYDKCIPRWLEFAMNPRGRMRSDFELLVQGKAP